MAIKTLKLTAYLCAIAYILISWGNLKNTVVCFGKDGHIAIEASQNFVCSMTTLTASGRSYGISANSTSPSSADHCGACVDVPFFIGSLGRYPVVSREFSTLTQPESLNFSFHSPEKLATQMVRDFSSINAFQPIISTHAPLQNVVLLI